MCHLPSLELNGSERWEVRCRSMRRFVLFGRSRTVVVRPSCREVICEAPTAVGEHLPTRQPRAETRRRPLKGTIISHLRVCRVFRRLCSHNEPGEAILKTAKISSCKSSKLSHVCLSSAIIDLSGFLQRCPYPHPYFQHIRPRPGSIRTGCIPQQPCASPPAVRSSREVSCILRRIESFSVGTAESSSGSVLRGLTSVTAHADSV